MNMAEDKKGVQTEFDIDGFIRQLRVPKQWQAGEKPSTDQIQAEIENKLGAIMLRRNKLEAAGRDKDALSAIADEYKANLDDMLTIARDHHLPDSWISYLESLQQEKGNTTTV